MFSETMHFDEAYDLYTELLNSRKDKKEEQEKLYKKFVEYAKNRAKHQRDSKADQWVKTDNNLKLFRNNNEKNETKTISFQSICDDDTKLSNEHDKNYDPEWDVFFEDSIDHTLSKLKHDTINYGDYDIVMNRINEMIGLSAAKSTTKNIFDYIKLNQLKNRKNLPVSDICLNMAFMGEPGTGKTTMARYYADLFKALGILKKGHLVEASRPDLIGSKIGQTEDRTYDLFMSALDGVLFIDEAHNLYQPYCQLDYGHECLSTLLKLMEDYRDRIIVIFAGYGEEMRKSLFLYKGLENRIPHRVDFKNYRINELIQIFEKMAQDYKYVLESGFDKKLTQTLKKYKRATQKNINARDIRNLYEKTVLNQSQRLAALSNLNDLDDEDLMLIKLIDIEVLRNYNEDNVIFF